jgi:L-ribulokinase
MGSAIESYTVGVEDGTRSGRAVVVRVSDGAEPGSAVSEHRHGVMDGTPATTDTRLPPHRAAIDSLYG